MKLSQSIIICVIIFNTNIVSQDSSIVSLTLGNTWVYNYSITSSTDPAILGTQVKEIVGDTIMTVHLFTCDTTIAIIEGQFKLVNTTTYINNQTKIDKEYWFADSNMFFKNIIWSSVSSFRYVYNHNQSIDTSWSGAFGEDCNAFFAIHITSDTLWSNIIETQSWSVGWHFPTSPNDEVLTTVSTYYFGPISEEYAVYNFNGSWLKNISILKGAILDGIVFGDTTVVSVKEEVSLIPTIYFLSQNYPNPFNPSTKIKFTIPQSPLPGGDGRGGFVTLKVYDLLGREVATLVNEEKPAGVYEVEYNASSLPSGIYFYQLRAGNYIETKKMVLLK